MPGPSVTPGEASAPRETTWGARGIALGLLLIALVVVSTLKSSGGPQSAEEYLAAWFEVSDLPFDLAPAEASLLPGGERLLVLERPDARIDASEEEQRAEDARVTVPEETPSEEAPPGEASPGEQGVDEHDTDPVQEVEATEEAPPRPETDWSKVEMLEAGTPPSRVIIVRYPVELAERAYMRQFRRLNWTNTEHFGDDGGRTVTDNGRLDWGEFKVSYVHERLYEKRDGESVFRDSIRVNLAVTGNYCMAYAFWPRGYPASKERVAELLDKLGPVEDPEPEAVAESE